MVSLTTGGVGANDHTFDTGFAATPLSSEVSVSGRVLTSEGRGVTNAVVSLIEANGNVRNVLTGRWGYFNFSNVEDGQTVVVSVRSRRFSFSQSTHVISLTDNVADLNFVADQ